MNLPKSLPVHLAVDCLRLTNKFAKDLLAAESESDKTINELADMVQGFYQLMNDRFENHFVYKGISSEQTEALSDYMEQLLNERIYQAISTRIVNEDEEHNMAVQKRIRSMNWITAEHLEINLDFQHPVVHDLLDRAICQMIEMNSRTSSIDKLECIVKCSKTIFDLLQVKGTVSSRQSDEDRSTSAIAADQFLPVLVFVVIQANPPMLPADMRYLAKFSNPRRLMSGETGYYFTNLSCALEFIEKANGSSLNISDEDFRKFMKGEAIPETKSKFNTYLCDGLRIMCSNDDALKKLREKNALRRQKMDNLLNRIDGHLEKNRTTLKDLQDFTLGDLLKPTLPKLYHETAQRNLSFAQKLLPAYLRPKNHQLSSQPPPPPPPLLPPVTTPAKQKK